MGKQQLSELETRGYYISVPKGISMWPMLRNGKDAVEIHKLDGKAKRYDLVMYIRGEDQGVIHRVLKVRDTDYVIAGDNCWQKEIIDYNQVKGIAVRFSRNGKWHDMDEIGYRIYVRFWTDLFFIRRPVFMIRDRIKHLFRRKDVRE